MYKNYVMSIAINIEETHNNKIKWTLKSAPVKLDIIFFEHAHALNKIDG